MKKLKKGWVQGLVQKFSELSDAERFLALRPAADAAEKIVPMAAQA